MITLPTNQIAMLRAQLITLRMWNVINWCYKRSDVIIRTTNERINQNRNRYATVIAINWSHSQVMLLIEHTHIALMSHYALCKVMGNVINWSDVGERNERHLKLKFTLRDQLITCLTEHSKLTWNDDIWVLAINWSHSHVMRSIDHRQ